GGVRHDPNRRISQPHRGYLEVECSPPGVARQSEVSTAAGVHIDHRVRERRLIWNLPNIQSVRELLQQLENGVHVCGGHRMSPTIRRSADSNLGASLSSGPSRLRTGEFFDVPKYRMFPRGPWTRVLSGPISASRPSRTRSYEIDRWKCR